MVRTRNTPAIVINLKPLGDNNTSVTLLTKTEGVIYAILYGGQKSKMRSLVSQWNSGIVYLYNNPEKKQIKISDFDVKKYHVSFGKNLFKMFAASLAAELAIKSKCAGSYEDCFVLVSGFIDGLDLVNEDQGRLGLVRFLWRFLELLGVQPDAISCNHCRKSFVPPASFAHFSENYYNAHTNSFVCCDCIKNNNAKEEHSSVLFPIKSSAINYLAAVSKFSASDVRKLQIDKEGYEQIRNIVFFLIENSLETKLNTIETGVGIL